MVVSKTQSVQSILTCYELGQRDFGENRVAELKLKAAELKTSCPDIRWHFIGHLQSNKIKDLLAIPHLVSIHSIHSTEILTKILQAPVKELGPGKKSIGLFLEIKTTDEPTKSGMSSESEIEACISLIHQQKDGAFHLQGLMTMAPLIDDEALTLAHRSFQNLKSLAENLNKKFKFSTSLELSMGMSQDYLVAVFYQSNWIRIGSKIFS
jgi:pyridoxal phosphate enzyme (YggS family)